jgi:hypothetical protein
MAAAALACCTLGSPAMTRVTHLRSRASDQEPVPTHHHASTHHAASLHSTASHSSGHATSSHAKAVASVSLKSHKGHAEPVAEPSSHHTTHTLRETASRTSSHDVHARPTSSHSSHETSVVAKAKTPAPPARHEEHATETADAKPAAAKSLTSDDFLRAAGVAKDTDAPKGVYAQGVSHPAEMDDEEPAPTPAKVVAQKQPAAQVSTDDLADTQLKPVVHRVEGFGPEGVNSEPTHRTLAKTMADHRTEFAAPIAKPEPPSAVEQAEITEEAIKPVVVPALYSHGGRLIMPASLKGSREVLVHQNQMADSEGLERIKNDDALNRLRASHELIRLPETSSLDVNDELPIERRYARPWTVHFAVDIAKAYASRFGDPLRVNSAVRTVSYQLRLQRVNGNAASVEGDTASPHLTGQAIDFGKHGMTSAEIAWMRAYLLPLMQTGKIDVEEEFQQACFHISVYRSYTAEAPKRVVKTEVASATRLRRVSQASGEDDDSSDQ